MEPQHPPGLNHYVTDMGPELRKEQLLLTYWQRETEPSLKQCSSPETLPHIFEKAVFCSLEEKSRTERMGDHGDAEQLRERQRC